MDAAEGISDALENALFLPISLSLLSTSLSPPVSRESQFRPPSCTSFRSFLGPFQGSPKAKVAKKGKEERKKWREREKESFSASVPDEVTA